jgi:quaternary ammonium compound-resistance protein SugE
MAWIVLFVAGLFEVGWAVGLKYTEGFSRLWPSVGTVASMIVSLGLLGLALRTLPLGTAYAIWTGVGTVGTALLGIMLFHEAADPIPLVCIEVSHCTGYRVSAVILDQGPVKPVKAGHRSGCSNCVS